MSDKTRIEWTDATWNPTTGCTKVSEGCRNCYALTLAERFRGTPGHFFENGFDVTLRHDKLETPLFWKKPRRIFVNSMSDLFHEKIPDDFIEDVFGIMSLATQHTFQILTKRPDRMLDFYKRCVYNGHMKGNHPLPNVWLGVSVEDQKAAEERIPLLLQTPATVRFLSCEPLLGPVDLMRVELGIKKTRGYGERRILWDALEGWEFQFSKERTSNIPLASIANDHPRISWVIAGGESGPKARPMHPEWVRSLRDQCVDAGVPFFFKQWGEFSPKKDTDKPMRFENLCGKPMYRVGKKKAGRKLDGQTWDEFPDCSKVEANKE